MMRKKGFVSVLAMAFFSMALYISVHGQNHPEEKSLQADSTSKSAQALFETIATDIYPLNMNICDAHDHSDCSHSHASILKCDETREALRPMWTRAKRHHNGRIETWIVPLAGLMARKAIVVYPAGPQTARRGDVNARLVIQRLDATGEVRCFVQTRIRLEQFPPATKNWNHYSEPSGWLLLLSQPDGRLIYAYRMEEGRSRRVALRPLPDAWAEELVEDWDGPTIMMLEDSDPLGADARTLHPQE